MGFEPTITEFCSHALTYWAIRPWAHFALRANLVQLLQFHLFVQYSGFISAIAFISHHICFTRNLAQIITSVQLNELIQMVFTTKGFWEVPEESWPEWDLNPRSLNSVHTLWPTELLGHELNLHSELTWYSYSNFISLFSIQVSFQPLSSSAATFTLSEILHR